MTFDPLAFPGPLQRGARDTNPSGPVHRLQGWLNLHGYVCAVDGDFGPETETTLDAWRNRHVGAYWVRGPLTEDDWRILTAPLARAMATEKICRCGEAGCFHAGTTLGDVVASTARQWLTQSVGGGPLRELPGNSGPVVEACTRWLAERDRLPCCCGVEWGLHPAEPLPPGVKAKASCGDFSPEWRLPWCAGWVSTVLRQACESLGVPMPIKGSLSCDELARQAWDACLLRACEGFKPEVTHATPRPGDLFLVRGAKPGDWTHCGVVLEVLPPVPLMTLEGRKFEGGGIRTAEGNTSKDGSREGTVLREGLRGMDGLDFICWRGA